MPPICVVVYKNCQKLSPLILSIQCLLGCALWQLTSLIILLSKSSIRQYTVAPYVGFSHFLNFCLQGGASMCTTCLLGMSNSDHFWFSIYRINVTYFVILNDRINDHFWRSVFRINVAYFVILMTESMLHILSYWWQNQWYIFCHVEWLGDRERFPPFLTHVCVFQKKCIFWFVQMIAPRYIKRSSKYIFGTLYIFFTYGSIEL